MKAVKLLVTLIILVIAFGAAVYTQRVQVSDWFSEMKKLSLPEAVTFEEANKSVGAGLSFSEENNKIVSEVVVAPTKKELVSDTVAEAKDLKEEPVLEKVVLVKEEDLAQKENLNEENSLESSSEAVLISSLPLSVNLGVPFTSQAPHANWSFPYKEACEEASVYMVSEFLKGTSSGKIPPDVADKGILQIVEFEKELFGYYEDTNIEQTSKFAEMLYGFEKIEVIENPTVEQIKQRLAQGLPVIVPAAGRELHNPNFTAPGPVYHMLVIRGYTENGKFITNDPGTRNGEAYLYDFDVIMNAMHDWNGGKDISGGKKVVMIIYPN